MLILKLLSIITASIAFMAITGCSDKKSPETAAPQNRGVIPQAQLDALIKAKSVENVIMQDAQRQREQADQQSQ